MFKIPLHNFLPTSPLRSHTRRSIGAVSISLGCKTDKESRGILTVFVLHNIHQQIPPVTCSLSESQMISYLCSRMVIVEEDNNVVRPHNPGSVTDSSTQTQEEQGRVPETPECHLHLLPGSGHLLYTGLDTEGRVKIGGGARGRPVFL